MLKIYVLYEYIFWLNQMCIRHREDEVEDDTTRWLSAERVNTVEESDSVMVNNVEM